MVDRQNPIFWVIEFLLEGEEAFGGELVAVNRFTTEVIANTKEDAINQGEFEIFARFLPEEYNTLKVMNVYGPYLKKGGET